MDRRQLFTALTFLGVLNSPCSALAADLPESLASLRQAVEDQNRRAVKGATLAVAQALEDNEGVVPHTLLAWYWYYQGVMAHDRGKSSMFMDAWRKTLIVDNDFEWDRTLRDNPDARRLFEALRKEVRQMGVLDPAVPEKTGLAQAYVDGTRVRVEDRVSHGVHLAQIQCPEGDVHGKWLDFDEESLDWLGLCPGGVDTTIVVADVFGESEFGDMGADFFDEEPVVAAAPEPASEPEPEPEPEASESKAEEPEAEPEPVAKKQAQPESVDRHQSSFLSDVSPRYMVMIGGGVMVTTGLVLNFAVVEPAYAKIEAARESPSSVSRSEADALTSRFDTGRVAAMALMLGGVAVTGTGAVLLDGAVKPVVTLAGFGLRGTW